MTPESRALSSTRERFWLRVYAWTSGLAGATAVVLAVGPGTFGAGPATEAIGAVGLAVAGWAASLARIEDPARRRVGLAWFALTHFFLVSLAQAPIQDLWPEGSLGRQVVMICGLVVAVALLSWAGRSALAAQRERGESRYEAAIRRAGAQEERNRLARDLHDSVKQQIFAIHTAAATAETRLGGDQDGAAAAIGQVRSAATDAMAEMNALLDQLQATPIGPAGLVDAIKQQCEALGHRTGAHVRVTIGELPAAEALPAGTHEALFRAAQEALSNIGRHARASAVTVRLGLDGGQLRLAIDDDGRGFDAGRPASGMGLANMRARVEGVGGALTLESQPGTGTRLTFEVPITTTRPNTSKWGRIVAGILFAEAAIVFVGVLYVGIALKRYPVYASFFGVMTLVLALRGWRARKART